MQESRLIQQLQKQNPKALQALMTEYQAYVGTIIRNITRSALTEFDVEELTADTFFAVWRTADKLQNGKVRSYLAAIARNKAKSRLRGQKETLPLDDTIILETADLTQEVENTLLAETLQDLIQLLTEADREIMIRHYYYYQKLSDIADEMKLTESAVKVRLHRARKKLKQLLIERGYLYETESV